MEAKETTTVPAMRPSNLGIVVGWKKRGGDSDKEDARKVAGRKWSTGVRMVVPVEPLLIGPAPLYLSNLSALRGTTHDITIC